MFSEFLQWACLRHDCASAELNGETAMVTLLVAARADRLHVPEGVISATVLYKPASENAWLAPIGTHPQSTPVVRPSPG